MNKIIILTVCTFFCFSCQHSYSPEPTTTEVLTALSNNVGALRNQQQDERHVSVDCNAKNLSEDIKKLCKKVDQCARAFTPEQKQECVEQSKGN